MMKFLTCALLMCCCTFLLNACGEDDPVRPSNQARVVYVTPTTPERVMQNFVMAMNEEDAAGYLTSIRADFEFHQDIPQPDVTDWFFADENIYINHLFLGLPFVNEEGQAVQPINSITLTLQPVSTWVESTDPRFPAAEGHWRREYAVVFDVGTPDLILQVRNNCLFYVVEADSVDGEARFELSGQVELPSSKGTEENTWGSVRNLYR